MFEDLDWKNVAGVSESPEIRIQQAELEKVLTEIDRTSQMVDKLTAMTDDIDLVSPSLFAKLDDAKAKLADAGRRKEKMATLVTAARSKAQALYSPEQLLEAIR